MLRFFGYLFYAVGLAPLAWCTVSPKRYPPAIWGLAGAFAVSFVADTLGLFGLWPLTSEVYPVSQAAGFLAVLVPWKDLRWLIGVLLFAASLSVVLRGGTGTDWILHATAGVLVCTMAASRTTGWVRRAVLVGYGGFTLGWLLFVVQPSTATWAIMQGARLLGALLWLGV